MHRTDRQSIALPQGTSQQAGQARRDTRATTLQPAWPLDTTAYRKVNTSARFSSQKPDTASRRKPEGSMKWYRAGVGQLCGKIATAQRYTSRRVNSQRRRRKMQFEHRHFGPVSGQRIGQRSGSHVDRTARCDAPDRVARTPQILNRIEQAGMENSDQASKSGH